jgi:hypothetical protein
MRRRLEDACKKGGTTYFGSGINPGFTMDVWPIFMSRISRRVDQIHIVETLDMRNYSSASAMSFMGFGAEADAPSKLDDMHTDPSKSVFWTSMLMVADALRFELEDYRYEREIGLATVDIETAFGTIRAGTTAVVRMRCVGVAYGRDVLVNEWVWRVTDDVNPEWGTGEHWTLNITGDPSMKCVVEATTNFDSGRIVSLTVATAALNALPTVCEASPGVKTPLDLPCWGGGYVGPELTAS